MRGIAQLIVVPALLLAPAASSAGTPPPPAIAEVLTAPDAAQGDELGRSVAVAGPFIAAGRWLADPGGITNAGAAHVWRRTAEGTTVAEVIVSAPDAAANDELGVSVGLSAGCDLGDPDDPLTWPRLIVGAWRADLPGKSNAGAAYVYRRDPATATWHFEAKLTASDSAADSEYGRSVAIEGTLAVVGAWQHQFQRGAVYVHRLDPGGWVQEARLLASDGASGDGLGVSVDFDGTRLVAGAWGDDIGIVGNQGSAYVFVRSDSGGAGTWTQEAKLVAADGASSDEFGRGVAIDGDTALVGTWPFWNDGPGAAYVFTRSGAAWSQQAKLTHPAPGAADYFGFSVGLSGDVAIVGAWADDVDGVTNQGSAHVFVREVDGTAGETTWSHRAELTRPEPQGSAYFGFDVAIDGAVAAVGSRLDDVVHVNQGSVTIVCIDPPACINCPDETLLGDIDGDGRVNGADLAILLGAWGSTGEPPDPPHVADLDGSGTVDGADLAILLGAWTG